MATCRYCGAQLSDEIDYCLKCGKSKSGSNEIRAVSATKNVAVSSLNYAGFWRRAAAFMIDGFLYQVGCMLLATAITMLIAFMPEQLARPLQPNNAKVGSWIQWGWLTVVPFLVFSLPLRVWGGQTVGKKILGIKVVDNLGNALSWGKCVGRPMLYLLSMMGLLGFLWSLWDREKRCWHDFIARTHVVRLA